MQDNKHHGHGSNYASAPNSGGQVRIGVDQLFLSLERHLKKLVPRLGILTHLSHLKPFTFFIQLDGVAHPPALRNLQSPVHRIGAPRCVFRMFKEKGQWMAEIQETVYGIQGGEANERVKSVKSNRSITLPIAELRTRPVPRYLSRSAEILWINSRCARQRFYW